MSNQDKTLQTVSIALIVVAVLLSLVSYNAIGGIKQQVADLETLSTSISGDVGTLASSIDALSAAIEELSDRPVPTPSITPAPAPAPSPATADEDKVVLRIGYNSAPRDFDPPHYGNDFLNGIDQLVHEPLFRMWWGPSGEIIFKPIIAESYEQVDELTWDFKIREGLKFSDGTELDIQDVYWSLSRDDPRPGNMIWSLDARIESYEIIDDWTIRMVTKVPMNNLFAWLCQGWTNIVSYDWVVETDNINNYPMVGIPPGTGPWKWYDIEPMVYAKMDLNPHWRGNKPRIDEIEIYAAVDDTARVMAFEAGSFDFIFPTPIEAVESLEDAGYKLWIKPTPIMQQIQMNSAYPPTDDIRVRKAITHAINREELVPVIWGKYASVIDSPAPVGTSGYKSHKVYDYDPAKAKALLADAGYADGLDVDFYVTSGREKHLEAATAIKTYLADVGITANLILAERAAMNALTRGARADYLEGKTPEFQFHLNFRGWHADTLWAGDDLFSLYYSEQSNNRWYNENPELDALLDLAISTAPYAERVTASEEAQVIWMENAYGVMLYAAPYIYTTVPELENIYTEPNVYVWFADSYFED